MYRRIQEAIAQWYGFSGLFICLSLKVHIFCVLQVWYYGGWGLGGGTIKFNYTIRMYMYTKRKSKCCTWINMTLYVTSSRLNHLLPAH